MEPLGRGPSLKWRPGNVRFWHKADMPIASPLSGVKRTLVGRAPMSAYDPKRTLQTLGPEHFQRTGFTRYDASSNAGECNATT
jgi:hypothetical protein